MSQIWLRPASSGLLKARVAPSGEKRGEPSLGPEVKSASTPLSMSIMTICDRVVALSDSTLERTKASFEPSPERAGSETLTIW